MNTVNRYQQGSLLIEAIIGVLIFMMAVVALFRYQEMLVHQFSLLQDEQNAWQFAQYLLESYPDDPLPLKVGWQKQLTVQPVTERCKILFVVVETDSGVKAKLTRWFCQPF